MAAASADPPELERQVGDVFDQSSFTIPTNRYWPEQEAVVQDRQIDMILANPDQVILFWSRATQNWHGWPHPGYLPHRAKVAIAHRAIHYARDMAMRDKFRRMAALAGRINPTRITNSVILYALGKALEDAGSAVEFKDPPALPPKQLATLDIDRLLKAMLFSMGFTRDDVTFRSRGADGSVFKIEPNPDRSGEKIYVCTLDLNIGREVPISTKFVLPTDHKLLTVPNVEKALEMFSVRVHREQYPIRTDDQGRPLATAENEL